MFCRVLLRICSKKFSAVLAPVSFSAVLKIVEFIAAAFLTMDEKSWIAANKCYLCRDEVDINLNIELESLLSSQALLGQTSSQVAEQVRKSTNQR